MLFSSIPYVFLFLPGSLAGFFLLGHFFGPKSKLVWLAICSVFFYAYWRSDYLVILLGSIAVNFLTASAIQKSIEQTGLKNRRSFLLVSSGIVFNLGLLGYFKYFDFFIETLNDVTGSQFQSMNLMLPLAISFFTFQQIAYLLDSYKGIAKRSTLLDYFVFVTFFPQLIAGPIVHHKEMMPQFMRRTLGVMRWKHLLAGAIIFSLGLFKKIGIADQFAVYADQGYADHANLTMLDAWVTTLSYTFQLYFDFSGYSDMAIGAARMFGINLPLNFFSPYKAQSIQQFWRRWHMTLSRFLRDYVYVPLGGSRCSEGRINVNLMATFLLGGLWHGAGWTFVIWGAIHGAALIISRQFAKLNFRLPGILNWLITFLVVHLGWVFFRADTISEATVIIKTMFGAGGHSLEALNQNVITDSDTAAYFLLLGFFVALVLPNSFQFSRDIRPIWKTIVAGILFGIACIAMLATRSQVFLYFNF